MSSEQILEKKSPQDFLESEKCAALKKEVAESVVGVFEDKEDDQDIAPVFDYFKKEAVKNGLSEVQAEKMFWQTVAENIKETRFKDIFELIRRQIENKVYELARRLLMEELNKIVEQLSHTLYANLSRKSTALTVLKEKFYGLFPEVEALIEETEEKRKAGVKIPTGHLSVGRGEEDEMPPPSEGEFREELRSPYLVEQRGWDIPDFEELVPGLVIALLDRIENRDEILELIDFPKKVQDGNTSVKVKWNDSFGTIYLADFGLQALPSGKWNSRYFLKYWRMKNKNK